MSANVPLLPGSFIVLPVRLPGLDPGTSNAAPSIVEFALDARLKGRA